LVPSAFSEIKTAARLQHPHILPVHDSETAGQLWYTMPFMEGESLRDRLHRARQLAIEEA
jgi:serine/threonine-protein kinase